MLATARAEGATVVTGGERTTGLFLQPTLVTGIRVESELFQEEVFGPVLCALPFADDREAIALANATRYGLVAGVWTRDLSRAHRVAAGIRAGQVFVNTLWRRRRRRTAVRRHEGLRPRPRQGRRRAAGVLAGQEHLYCHLGHC